ncbi:unnamed protein product [Toxocara canis]|uniref:Tudor domain-containing protein n=1 Tax=Toxocara canis TaxID=6265 RepID=A0A183UWA9_TOXCA|nr:unnamed protein product [Toxocara canis]
MNGRTSPIFEMPSGKGGLPKMVRNGDVGGDGRYTVCLSLPNTVIHARFRRATLMPLEKVDEGLYVMAPLSKGLYARARIVQLGVVGSSTCTKMAPNYAKVLFIDEGTTSWMSCSCLAKMDEILSFHPWQAIAVSLFKVRPKNGVEWSKKECETLRTILGKYTLVQIAVALSTVQTNNYRDLVKVNMAGIENDKDSVGSSVAHLLARQCKGIVYDHLMFDGFAQKAYPASDNDESSVIGQLVHLEEWRSRFPETANEKSNEVEQYAEWIESGIGPQIPVVDVGWLRAEGYLKGSECIVSVEGRYTISPYEFYVRPLVMKKSQERTDEAGDVDSDDLCAEQMDAMIAANDELLKMAEDLNSCYGHPKNRKPISVQRVRNALEKGKSTYGVAEVDGGVTRFMGCWQRVEIIGLKAVEKTEEYYCRLRYLDSGGTDIRLLSSVVEIYPVSDYGAWSKLIMLGSRTGCGARPKLFMSGSWSGCGTRPKHCERPPLCLQVCLQGIKPAKGDEWSAAAREYFFRELREDVPISLKVLGALNKFVIFNAWANTRAFLPNV